MAWRDWLSSSQLFSGLYGAKQDAMDAEATTQVDSAFAANQPTSWESADTANSATVLYPANSGEKATLAAEPEKPQEAAVTILHANIDLEPDSATSESQGTVERVVVAGYDIFEELGRGGMGVVYKARHRQLQRLVALKMILAGAHAGASGLARFRAEAEAVAQLQHPNIVQVYEIGEHEGMPYFSLELVEGGSLSARLKEAPPPPQGAAYLMESLARAIHFAHQHKIVHRDLKPANILLGSISGLSTTIRGQQPSAVSWPADHWSRTAVPKITDFGLAKRVDDDAAGQTHTGTILGTPSYMSPEQASGKVHEIGPASDIYSLGAILYEMLTGRAPFKASNPIDVIHQVIDQEPVRPSQLEPRERRYIKRWRCTACRFKTIDSRRLTNISRPDRSRKSSATVLSCC